MELELSEPGQICLQALSKEELVKVITDLIREDRDVKNAILELLWSCPNIVTEL